MDETKTALTCRCSAPNKPLPCLGDRLCGYTCQRLSPDLAKMQSPKLKAEWDKGAALRAAAGLPN